jgi:hypothetical protein
VVIDPAEVSPYQAWRDTAGGFRVSANTWRWVSRGASASSQDKPRY